MINLTINLGSWGWPQWTIVIFSVLAGFIHLVKDGQPRENYSIGLWVVGSIITYAILIAGGFFA